MQHVYGQLGTWVMNAAVVGTFGLVSNPNLAARWARENFDMQQRW